MEPSTPAALVQLFIDKINTHDVRGLCELLSDDHRFVDSLGDEVRGSQELRKAWITYFYLFPDFSVTSDEMIERGDVVVVIGSARGTYAPGQVPDPKNSWHLPAAWRAAVRDGRIAEWRIFADNEPVRRIIASQGA